MKNKLALFTDLVPKFKEKFENIQKYEGALDKNLSKVFKTYLNKSGFKSYFCLTSLGEMHYYDSNPKSNLKPLIFLHGLGSSAQSWWILAKMLSNKRRIIIPDLFSMSGFSETNQRNLSFEHHENSLKEFISKVTDTQNVDLCGLSMGGWLSLSLAVNYKVKIDSIILLNPAGIPINPFALRDTLTHLDWNKFHSLYPGIMKAFPYTRMPIFSKLSKRGLYLNLTSEKVKNLLKNTRKEHFLDNKVKDIKCPVLLLWGKEDHLLSAKIPVYLSTEIPNIEAFWVDKCAHVLALEAPALCYKEIVRFLNLGSIKDNNFAKTLVSFAQNYKLTPISIKSN